MIVGPAQVADHEAILALHREAGWSTSTVYGDVLIVRAGDRVVAAIHLMAFPSRDFLVIAMVVGGDRRGHGIGARLMRMAMASRPGLWWLECRAERVAFYRRLGFSVVDEAAVPPAIRTTIGVHPSRPQVFMRREVDDPCFFDE